MENPEQVQEQQKQQQEKEVQNKVENMTIQENNEKIMYIDDIIDGEEKKIDIEKEDAEPECYECDEEFFLDSVRLCDIDDVVDCLKDNIDITWFDKHLNNALHMIAGNGHVKLLDLLFIHIEENKWSEEKLNKFINQQNADGQTPLHFATICDQKDVVQYLLQKNADCNIKNQMKNTPVEEALDLEKYEIAELLAKYTKGDIEDEEYKDVDNYQVAVTKDDEEEAMNNDSNSEKGQQKQ